MKRTSAIARARRSATRVSAAAVCSLTLLLVAQAHAQGSQAGSPSGPSGAPVSTPGGVSAALEGCVTAALQSERSATFSGEMTATAATARMSMRVDVEEQIPGEGSFHMVVAPGLGVWRSSDARVKVYKYLKQVTNLTSPAVYRALVHFRWLNSKGHLIKRADRLTPRCAELATATASAPGTAETGSGTSIAAISAG